MPGGCRRCCDRNRPLAALATRRRLDVEALLLVSVGIGVGGTRGGSQGGIILQPGDLALDIAEGLASGMPDRNPALTGQLFAVVRRGRFGKAGRPRSVMGLEVADGLDRAFATAPATGPDPGPGSPVGCSVGRSPGMPQSKPRFARAAQRLWVRAHQGAGWLLESGPAA